MAVKCRRKGDAAVLSRDLYEYVVQKIDGLIKLVRGGGSRARKRKQKPKGSGGCLR